MENNSEIIVEIGYNHLGSIYILKKLMERVIKNRLNITFQIRSQDFISKEILDINLDYLIRIIKFYKNKYPKNFQVGFALDSLNFFEKISSISDFIKILSIFSEKKEFLSTTNYKKPIFVSLGLDSIKEIESLSNATKKNNIKFNSIFTTFDSTGQDISIKELNLIDSISDSISFGYHQNNIFLIPTLISLINFKNIFIYLNPGFDDNATSFLPDAKHSVKIDEILKIKETLKLKNIIMKNKPRGSFKEFSND